MLYEVITILPRVKKLVVNVITSATAPPINKTKYLFSQNLLLKKHKEINDTNRIDNIKIYIIFLF